MSSLEERLARHLREIADSTEESVLNSTQQEIEDVVLASAESLELDRFMGPAGGQGVELGEFRPPPIEPQRATDEAMGGFEALRAGRSVDRRQLVITAAIVLSNDRPTYTLSGDWLTADPRPPFAGLAQHQDLLRGMSRAIGRIQARRAPYSQNVAGTGFLVGPNLLMTNRHVANYFVEGVGERGDDAEPGLVFEVDGDPRFDLKAEAGSTESIPLDFVEPLMMHPYWDVAILQVQGDGLDEIEPLKLEVERPDEVVGETVVVIGYPVKQYLESRDLRDLRDTYFGSAFGIKRLMPGKLLDRQETTTQDPFSEQRRTVPAIGHDASTLAGNSGSAVLDLQRGVVRGVHFRGIALDANFAVPAWELARDPRLHDLGVHFASGPVEDADPAVEAAWGQAA